MTDHMYRYQSSTAEGVSGVVFRMEAKRILPVMSLRWEGASVAVRVTEHTPRVPDIDGCLDESDALDMARFWEAVEVGVKHIRMMQRTKDD